jgi:hypothetical protein
LRDYTIKKKVKNFQLIEAIELISTDKAKIAIGKDFSEMGFDLRLFQVVEIQQSKGYE